MKNKDMFSPFFLLLHGDFAWRGMELISALQEILNEDADHYFRVFAIEDIVENISSKINWL